MYSRNDYVQQYLTMYSSKDYICTIIPDCAIAATTNTWLYTATAIIPEAKICTVVIQGGK